MFTARAEVARSPSSTQSEKSFCMGRTAKTPAAKAFLFAPRSGITTLICSNRIIVTSDEIKERLKQVKYPGFSRDIVSFGLVRSAGFFDGTVKVALSLASNDPKTPLQLKKDIEQALRDQPGVKDIIVEIAVAPAKAPAAPAGG